MHNCDQGFIRKDAWHTTTQSEKILIQIRNSKTYPRHPYNLAPSCSIFKACSLPKSFIASCRCAVGQRSSWKTNREISCKVPSSNGALIGLWTFWNFSRKSSSASSGVGGRGMVGKKPSCPNRFFEPLCGTAPDGSSWKRTSHWLQQLMDSWSRMMERYVLYRLISLTACVICITVVLETIRAWFGINRNLSLTTWNWNDSELNFVSGETYEAHPALQFPLILACPTSAPGLTWHGNPVKSSGCRWWDACPFPLAKLSYLSHSYFSTANYLSFDMRIWIVWAKASSH